ncbi:hypothetical protein [Tenacibaculum finnmarkense]|uniref:hypothetical protein n=1 Tax=Tenacibaculum finnmarkense TaxID=2781243 RepID=UPI00207A964C|nr:hypothetical protein [Tenacibaculum finnmarkense]MCM8906814.1 hypothetical protein [Tenacibaculum finnmarkense genomovar finnmarkense]
MEKDLLKQEIQWIDCSKTMPSNTNRILTWDGMFVQEGHYSYISKSIVIPSFKAHDEIIFWAELPNPPISEAEKNNFDIPELPVSLNSEPEESVFNSKLKKYIKNNWNPLLLGFSLAIMYSILLNTIDSVIVKLALIFVNK